MSIKWNPKTNHTSLFDHWHHNTHVSPVISIRPSHSETREHLWTSNLQKFRKMLACKYAVSQLLASAMATMIRSRWVRQAPWAVFNTKKETRYSQKFLEFTRDLSEWQCFKMFLLELSDFPLQPLVSVCCAFNKMSSCCFMVRSIQTAAKY